MCRVVKLSAIALLRGTYRANVYGMDYSQLSLLDISLGVLIAVLAVMDILWDVIKLVLLAGLGALLWIL